MGPESPATPPPRWREPDVLFVLVLTFACQLFSWSRLEGYQLADSVEYIERAQGYLFGHEVLGPSSVRSFAFSALFLPLFWITDQLGIEDSRFLVYVFRFGTASLGILLCLSCMRVGALVAGRRAGIVTGLLIGTNPIFLQYSISPVSGIAAALCVSLGLERCLQRESMRFHAIGGLWLGVGFMMAYQTIPIAGTILVMMLARERWQHFRRFGGAVLGFFGGLAGQVLLDRVSYGEWGSSIFRYILDNAGGILVRLLGKYLKMGDAAQWLYSKIEELHKRDYTPEVDVDEFAFQSIQETNWYFEALPAAIVWPAIALFFVGVVRALKRPRWASTLLLICLAANLFLLAQKSSKSFRLWLPLFPLLFPLAALGFDALRFEGPARRPRNALASLLLLAIPVLGLLALQRNDTRPYAIFWEATEWVNQRVERLRRTDSLAEPQDAPVELEGFGAGKVRISGSYHWAMFMRESPLLHLVKLPFEIEGWNGLDDKRKQRNIDTLLTLDWYVTHWPALLNHPDWMAVVNENFTVEAAFYDPESDPGLAAVFVLKRKPPFRELESTDARTFHSLLAFESESAYRMEHELGRPVDFVDASGKRARLVGTQYETLPGSGLGWVSYHWWSDLEERGPWTVIDRITSPDEHNAWQNDHLLAGGLATFAGLEPGTILRESTLVVPGVDAYSAVRPFAPLGGPHLRGDRIPADLWVKLVRYQQFEATEENPGPFPKVVLEELTARDGETGEPLPTERRAPTAAGWTTSPDGLQRVDRFLIERLRDLTEAFVPPEGPAE